MRNERGDESQLIALARRYMAPGEHHAHGPLERDLAREALHPPRSRREPNAGLGQRKFRLLRGDDDVGGERDLEAAAHGHTIDCRNQRLFKVMPVRDPSEAFRRALRSSPGLGPELGVIFEIVAGAKGLVSGAGNDRDPQLWICRELVEYFRQLLIRHRVEGVCDLGSIYGDDQETTVGLDLAVLAHGALLLEACRIRWDVDGTVLRPPRRRRNWREACPAMPARVACQARRAMPEPSCAAQLA